MRSNWNGWVLLDREAKLVAYNEEVYRGVSPRRVLGSVQRALLLPHLLETLQSAGGGVTKNHTLEGVRWRSYVYELRAPRSGEIVGVLGTVSLSSSKAPTRPIVGCWEWVVPSGNPSGEKESYWDRGLYDLYDVEPACASDARGAYTPPDWLYKVVSRRDAPRLHAMITKGISVVTPDLHTIIYQVTAGYGGENEYDQFLRLVGRAGQDENGAIRLTGVSHEVVGRVDEWTPGLNDEIASTDILAAMIGLTTSAMVLLDADSGQLIISSENGWSGARIAPPSSASLHDVVDRDTLNDTIRRLREVAKDGKQRVTSFVTKLRTTDSLTRPFAARATPVKTREAGTSYVMVEFIPLEN